VNWLTEVSWSPYAVGAGIGVLSWLTFVLSDKPLGCSSSYAHTTGMLERVLRGRKVLDEPYWKTTVPVVDWQWMLLVGIVIGAFLSAKLSGDFDPRWTHAHWVAAFGDTPVARVVVALVGGVFMGAGARWAGGCTSGHGISGTLQLNVSSWLAAACFFVGGIVTTMLLFRVIGG